MNESTGGAQDRPFDEREVFIAPPTDDQGYIDPSEVERPGWPKVIGILSIIFGSLGIIGGVCGGVGIAMMPMYDNLMKEAASQAGATYTPMPQPNVLMLIYQVGLFFAGVLLLVAGIMCVSRQAASRMLHLLWAGLKIFLIVFGIVVSWDYNQASQQWAAQLDPKLTQGGASFGIGVGANIVVIAIGTAWALAWPIFCLIWFGAVKTKRDDFTGGVQDTI